MASVSKNASLFEAYYSGGTPRWVNAEDQAFKYLAVGVEGNPYDGNWVVQVTFPSLGIGSGSITDAKLYLKTDTIYADKSRTFRIKASNTNHENTTTIPSGYATDTPANLASNTVFHFNVTAAMQNLADPNSAFYINVIQSTPGYVSDEQAYIQAISRYQIYLEVTYAIGSDTVGRYNGSTFENCEVYRYNGSTWELQDVFRYDGAQFVECSTT